MGKWQKWGIGGNVCQWGNGGNWGMSVMVRMGGMVLGCLLLAAPAWAQVETPQAAVRSGTDAGIRGKFSLMASYGLDLDVFGEVLTVGLGETPTRAAVVSDVVPYPKVYVSTPQRQSVSAGFGVFQRRELIVQYTRTKNVADPTVVGEVLTLSGRSPLRATFSSYEDMSIEGGLRHYFKATGPSRKYVNLLFGRRTVEAISARLTGTTADSDFGVVRLYDKATVPTAAIVFGITYERGPIGIFIEAGARWTQRLPRQDDDLRPSGLELINNTNSRIFMPASIGIVLRR
jgi:hypothetical protein